MFRREVRWEVIVLEAIAGAVRGLCRKANATSVCARSEW